METDQSALLIKKTANAACPERALGVSRRGPSIDMKLVLVLAVLFLGLLVLAVMVWLIWVRPFVKKAGARTASPFTLAALVADLATSMIYSRGPLPAPVRFFALLLMLLLSDLVLMLIVLFFVE
jgi:hypothetical protein